MTSSHEGECRSLQPSFHHSPTHRSTALEGFSSIGTVVSSFFANQSQHSSRNQANLQTVTRSIPVTSSRFEHGDVISSRRNTRFAAQVALPVPLWVAPLPVALWLGCHSMSSSAWGQFWPPVPRPCLLQQLPTDGDWVGFPLWGGVWAE